MIDLVICTYKRLDKQTTLGNIPKKFRDNVTLVVQPQEEAEARKVHPNIFVLDGDNIGYARTIEQTTKEFAVNRNNHFWLFDDDLRFVYNEETEYQVTGKKHTFTEQHFEQMLIDIEKELDSGLMHGALGTTWNFPWGKLPYIENSRMSGNKVYNKNLAKIWNDIDWVGCCGAEDFYVNLQLLTTGHANKVWHNYVVDPGPSYQDGGCSEYRDVEFHNKSCEDLQKLFPEFVKLRTKKTLSGPWKNLDRLGASVQWKKAYLSSQVATIKDFMS